MSAAAAAAALLALLTVPADGGPDRIAFPPPPDAARVLYVESILDSARFRPPRPWWKRLLGLVAGKPEATALVRPYGVDASGGSLWVCDPGAGLVHGFRADSTYVRVPREGAFVSPIDVATDSRGNLHITDSAERTVTCVSPSGEVRFRHDGDFGRPTGIAYHADQDRLYVLDTTGHVIHVHTPDGRRVETFGVRGAGPGELNFPTAIDIGSDGAIYVTDAMNFRVAVFDADGAFRTSIGRAGDRPGSFSKPKGAATDPDGNVWVVDALFDAVQIFRADGALLLSFGREGTQPGEFWLPAGIDVSDDGTVYVADSWNHRVQVFRYLEEETR